MRARIEQLERQVDPDRLVAGTVVFVMGTAFGTVIASLMTGAIVRGAVNFLIVSTLLTIAVKGYAWWRAARSRASTSPSTSWRSASATTERPRSRHAADVTGPIETTDARLATEPASRTKFRAVDADATATNTR